jgi:hypothetical protein
MNARQKSFIYLVALSYLLVCVASARADVQFSGTKDHVVLWAKNATIAEILSGIRSALNLRVGLTGSTERQFTGAYTGALQRVLSRLLDGEDYVISSAPNGMNIVLLGPKGAGRNTAPSIAPVMHTNGEQTLRLAAASDDEGNPNYQGWMPGRNPHKAASVKDGPAESNNSASAPAESSTVDEGNSSYQGWLPTGNLPKMANVNAGTFESNNSVTAPAASSTEDEGNQNYQGWLPTGNVAKTESTKLAPSLADSPAGPAAAAEEGNPNFQGYTPDWTPPQPGGSIRGSIPVLPGGPSACIGNNGRIESPLV